MSINKSPNPHHHKEILKSTAIVSLATFISRILGFIRDIVIARLFGVYLYAQAFVIAFKIPNLLRDLVGEGAVNSALVPVFSEYAHKKTKEEFWKLANVVLNILLIILSLLTLLGVLFSPLIVKIIAPGFSADPEKLVATINLNRLVFPYIILIGLVAYSMGILNSLKHFAVPAFAPCLLNISIIVFAMLFGEGITGLATGILVGGILQLVVQIPVLYKNGFRFNLKAGLKHPEIKNISKLMLPRIFSSSIYQLNNFIDTIFGSLAFIVGEGAVAVLYFAYRLVLLPIGIFSTALAQVILPTLSREALEENYEKLRQTISFSLGLTFFVMVPASAGLMFLAKPIVLTLFQGGRFDAYSSEMTAKALFFYSIGLFAYGSTKILQSSFFALKDTLTPTKISFVALISNVLLNLILMFPLKLGGLALATSLSGIFNFFALFYILNKKVGKLKVAPLLLSLLKISLCAIGMGLVSHFIAANLSYSGNMLQRLINIAIPIICGIFSYFIFCVVLRVKETKDFIKWLKTIALSKKK